MKNQFSYSTIIDSIKALKDEEALNQTDADITIYRENYQQMTFNHKWEEVFQVHLEM